MKKTFYSVQYINWGMDYPSTMWFDDREKAIEFASHDFRDRHVTHTFRNPEKIAEIEKRIYLQKLCDPATQIDEERAQKLYAEWLEHWDK